MLSFLNSDGSIHQIITIKRNLVISSCLHGMNILSVYLQRLYNLGARKIVVSEIGPIGCVPAITSQNKHKGKCVEHKNRLVAEYNSMLPAMLQNLTSSLQGSSFLNGHAYRLAYDAIINPSNYGKGWLFIWSAQATTSVLTRSCERASSNIINSDLLFQLKNLILL